MFEILELSFIKKKRSSSQNPFIRIQIELTAKRKIQSDFGKMSETSFSKQTASLAKTFMFRGFDPEEWARSLSAQSDGDKVRGVKNL